MHTDTNVMSANFETKYVLENGCVPKFIQWLKYRCLPDPVYPAGIVSSIYFDTWDWRFLREKINSDFLKTKIRVRWYTEINSGICSAESFLEAKFKQGKKRHKIRKKLDISGEWLSKSDLCSRDLIGLPNRLLKSGVILPDSLFPVFQIQYKRVRFVEPYSRARLSLDYAIRVPAVNQQRVPGVFPFNLQNSVFELKGEIDKLPAFLHQLTTLGCRKDSFSKYSFCYAKITGDKY